MSINAFKLDDLRTAAHEKYGHFAVELDEYTTVLLRNVLRLSEEEREKFTDRPDEMSALESLRYTIRIVAETAEGAERIIEALGDDLAVYSHVIDSYNKATQAGEA